LKKTTNHTLKVLLLALSFFAVKAEALAQHPGRVVINEYMPWTLNNCGGATAEFVELLNFGPGPINIGCYILTDGDYSVTIPENTILQPGQFYLIAGRDVIEAPCANIAGTVYADLNWNACNCTSAPIPDTAEGFFTDGGSGNEQVVLLDPFLNVVDAVVRALQPNLRPLLLRQQAPGVLPARSIWMIFLLITKSWACQPAEETRLLAALMAIAVG